MRSISDTIARLARQSMLSPGTTHGTARLKKLEGFGRNPGQLTGWYQTPEASGAAPALVVVLHGCTQSAAGYDHGSGWSELAADYGFAVLFPEQSRQNNGNLCFNWFNDDDVTRDRGEVLSIREMIASMVTKNNIDTRRIYVTGLSAGGAMATTLLATYPELFAGGAIIAGLPHGVASTVPEAFDRMRGHGLPSRAVLDNKLRSASSHRGPWPVISVWHGTKDNTVVEANAHAIIEQWQGVHAVDAEPALSDLVDGQVHDTWVDSTGRPVIEYYRISGMGHGTPLETASGYGNSAPYMLEVGISSTVHTARNWGLTPSFERRTASSEATTSSTNTSNDGIQGIIESALRSAGLMK